MRPEKAQSHVGTAGYPMPMENVPERAPFHLTKEMVLLAVQRAISPDSTYINDQVQRMHRDHVKSGGKGYPPRTDLVLSRLNALAKDGLLEKSTYTNGYYGYHWTITPAGRLALSPRSTDHGKP